MRQQKTKIGLITSRGGHLAQMMRMAPFWRKYRRFWITFPGCEEQEYLKKEKVHYAYAPDTRNIINAFKNGIMAISILRKEKPCVLLSCGGGIAVPFFLIGKLFGCRLIYIEPYDFVSFPSLTGKILYQFADLFLIQHTDQAQWYPKAVLWGSLY